MGVPNNPNTILFTNQYYPSGLKEIDVWRHYQKYKDKVIKEVNNRDVVSFIYTDNGYIIRRKDGDKNLTLNEKTYDRVITGRSVFFSVETGLRTNYAPIDIDAGDSVTEDEKKDCVDYLIHSPVIDMSFVIGYRIISSASSYHVYFLLNKKMDINVARKIIEKTIRMDPGNKYLVNDKRIDSTDISFDFTPLYPRGSHSVAWGLCRNGLIATDVTYNHRNFNRSKAIVR